MTLLKNEHTCCLFPSPRKHIAVIGPNANEARYADYPRSQWPPISMFRGIRALVPMRK